MRQMTITPAGDRGVMIDLGDPSADVLHAMAARVRGLARNGVTIAGHSSLLVLFDEPAALAEFLRRRIELEASPDLVADEPAVLQIPTSFAPDHAPDLPALLQRAGCGFDELLQRIGQLRLRARFLGFRPGFAYLEGWPREWSLPRRETSRTRVPGGSLGIADDLAAFYPDDSAGGWNIIGWSGESFWDAARNPPNLISAGDEVRIVPHEGVVDRRPSAERSSASPDEGEILATVIRPGQSTFVVSAPDLMRCSVGLPEGGPYDLPAAAAANRAVGNSPGEPLLECTLVGPRLRMERSAVMSWYGAAAAITINGDIVREPRQFSVGQGDIVEIGQIAGMRGYLAFGGGLVDSAGRFQVSPGLLATVLHQQIRLRSTSSRLGVLERGERDVLRVIAGPHEVDANLLIELVSLEWRAGSQLDRTGIRLSATASPKEVPVGVRSSGMQFGTIQLHPNGDLVVLGPDHPITGGYLQPFTLVSSDRWKLAQLTPGDAVRLRLVALSSSA